jgi:hypothetical protein
MRGVLCAMALLVCLNGTAEAQGRPGVWLRRLTLAAACASGVWDIYTTRNAVRLGAVESNRLLADGQGRPRWGRMIALNVGVCAGSALAQELLDRKRRPGATDYVWTGVNSALAVRHAAAAVHNRRVTAEMRRRWDYLLRPE